MTNTANELLRGSILAILTRFGDAVNVSTNSKHRASPSKPVNGFTFEIGLLQVNLTASLQFRQPHVIVEIPRAAIVRVFPCDKDTVNAIADFIEAMALKYCFAVYDRPLGHLDKQPIVCSDWTSTVPWVSERGKDPLLIKTSNLHAPAGNGRLTAKTTSGNYEGLNAIRRQIDVYLSKKEQPSDLPVVVEYDELDILVDRERPNSNSEHGGLITMLEQWDSWLDGMTIDAVSKTDGLRNAVEIRFNTGAASDSGRIIVSNARTDCFVGIDYCFNRELKGTTLSEKYPLPLCDHWSDEFYKQKLGSFFQAFFERVRAIEALGESESLESFTDNRASDPHDIIDQAFERLGTRQRKTGRQNKKSRTVDPRIEFALKTIRCWPVGIENAVFSGGNSRWVELHLSFRGVKGALHLQKPIGHTEELPAYIGFGFTPFSQMAEADGLWLNQENGRWTRDFPASFNEMLSLELTPLSGKGCTIPSETDWPIQPTCDWHATFAEKSAWYFDFLSKLVDEGILQPASN